MDLRSFPDEITTRILSYNYGNTSKIFSEKQLPHVNVSQYTDEALEFAKMPYNAELLCKTLQGCLILRSNTRRSQDLFNTLAPHLEEFIVESFSDEFVFRTTSECKNLKRLELREFPTEFDWSTLQEGLKEIFVTIDSKGQMTIIGDALGRLQVQELGIRYNCAMDPDDIDIYEEVRRICRKLAPSLNHLKKLSIEKVENSKTSTWDIIELFQAVDHVVITEPPTKKARNFLLPKQSIQLMTPAMDLAISLADKMTMIDLLHTSCEDSLKAEDIAKLSAFQNLRIFRARVLGGAETELHALPAGIKDVELHFTPGIRLQPGHLHHSMQSSVTVTAGSISKFLDGAYFLSGICIYGAEVDKEEMKEVLNRLGGRLLKFGVTVDTQDQSLIFMEDILNVIAQRNRSLKELNMKCEIFDEWEGLGVSEEIWVKKERLQRLEACLKRFHRSVPGAQVLYLTSLLRRLVRARL